VGFTTGDAAVVVWGAGVTALAVVVDGELTGAFPAGEPPATKTPLEQV